MPTDDIVSVRYMVDDVAAAVAFYRDVFDFEVLLDVPPVFAETKRGNLRLLLAGAGSSAGQAMTDGTVPGPGGWNRIHFVVDDLDAEMRRVEALGATFRNEVVSGPAGRQVLVVDPSDNLVELFEYSAR
jgi:predicted enzyme related to lactoylglutathione lyase